MPSIIGITHPGHAAGPFAALGLLLTMLGIYLVATRARILGLSGTRPLLGALLALAIFLGALAWTLSTLADSYRAQPVPQQAATTGE